MKNYNVKRISFNVDDLSLVGYLYSPTNAASSPGVLFIHGSAKNNPSNIFESWQIYLAKKGISSFSYFSRGVSESEGNYSEGNLINREKEALQALSTLINTENVDHTKIAILANSMGGHVASKISPEPKIKAVILYAAAAYSREAENKMLDRSFTKEITKNKSWQNSPAFEYLSRAKKPILVIYPQLDNVIPEGVKRKYKSILNNKKNFVVIPEATHITISELTKQDKKIMLNTFEISAGFIKNVLS